MATVVGNSLISAQDELQHFVSEMHFGMKTKAGITWKIANESQVSLKVMVLGLISANLEGSGKLSRPKPLDCSIFC